MSEVSDDLIVEAKRVIRVTSKGEKIRRIKCRRGYRLASSGVSCVPASGSEKASKRRAIRRAIRTKKAAGASFKRRVAKKRIRALKRRKSYGL